MDKEYKYNLKHYWNYFKINLFLSHKSLFEYKTNVINVLLIHFMQILMYLFFGHTFVNVYGNIIGWDFIDVLIFILSFTIIFHFLSHLFFARKNFETDIILGKLNLLLMKPGNIFLNYILKIEFSIIFYLLNILLYLGILIYLKGINFLNLFLSFPVMILTTIAFLSIFLFLDSLNFFILGGAKKITNIYTYQISRNFFAFFPGQLFKHNFLKYVIIFFPLYFVSTLVVPIIQGNIVEDFLFKIGILCLIIIVFSFGIYLSWKYGLKRYEAFG